MANWRENDPNCPCCLDCNDLTQYPYQIWFDANTDGTYELGPYPMTYVEATDLYTYDFARTFGVNLNDSCAGNLSTRQISVCYFKIKQGLQAGTHGVFQGIPVCKAGLISGFRSTFFVDPVPWERVDLSSQPTLSPAWANVDGNAWLRVGTTTIEDPCSWIVTTGTGGISIFGSTGLYNFRITRGTDPF